MKSNYLFIFLFLFSISCVLKPLSSLTIITPEKDVQFYVDIADTVEKQRLGLSNRTLTQNEGMIFIFDPPRETYFWMKDILIPLDIVYINEKFQVVNIKENAQPCSKNCPLYESKQPVKYVLEINGGLVKKYNIQSGQTVMFNKI